MKNQILNNFSYFIVNKVSFDFDMLVFNIKQVNLEYILRHTKQNLKQLQYKENINTKYKIHETKN